MSPFYGWGNSINVRCPGLQNVLLWQAESSPLETMGSAGLAPATPLTSLHSVPMVLHACCFPNAPTGSGLRASTLVLPSTWTIPQVSEWLPPSTPFRSLLQYHLLNDSSCSCISTLNPIPSIPPVPFLLCFIHSTDHFQAVCCPYLFVYCLFSPSECKLHEGSEFCWPCSPLPARPMMGTHKMLTNAY